MAKEMIISSNHFERKIAILEDGVLTEYYVERVGESQGIVGNIYKGRVTRVLPGMQSAFVDIGLERDAFLYVSDVIDVEDLEVEFEPAEERMPVSSGGREGGTDDEVAEILEALSESPAPSPERAAEETAPELSELVERLVEDLPQAEAQEEIAVAPEVDLKEAIFDEKITEALHDEEERVELEGARESEPSVEAPRVGSFHAQLGGSGRRQRIVDDSPESSPVTDASAPQGTPRMEIPDEGESLTAEYSAEEPEAPSGTTEMTSSAVGENEESASSEPDDPPLPDAEASVRHPRLRARFAARRRVRRRRSGRTGSAEASEERSESKPTITELLEEGQEILVQIAKEPIGTKGARVTTHITLPGRYLVYLPTFEHIGVSRRITSSAERARLRRLISELRAQQKISGGVIVRTAAEGCREAELLDDLMYLYRTWVDIRTRAERARAPQLIHRELDLVERILRDRLSDDFTAIRVDDEDDYARILNFIARLQPKLLNRVKLHTRPTPIFEDYGIQAEIEKAIRPRVWLKSGGYIVINQTEALVAIDVNTGKFVGKTNRFEDTITRTNIEAAREIARQIRLRDLGGIIVLDFIDMEERKNRQKVMQVLEEELRKDRAPTKILQFNDFGLVAITRKRVKQSLERTLCEPCPYCHGSGLVKSPQTVCLEILEEAKRMALAQEVEHGKEAILRVHPEVARALREKYPKLLEEVEAYLGGNVTLKTDPLIHQEQFDIAVG
jgi:ribonuclease G